MKLMRQNPEIIANKKPSVFRWSVCSVLTAHFTPFWTAHFEPLTGGHFHRFFQYAGTAMGIYYSKTYIEETYNRIRYVEGFIRVRSH